MRVLVCGSRTFNDWDLFKDTMSELVPGNDHTIISGAARGADTMASEWAKYRGCALEEYPAKWYEYGKAAGPIRNKQMLDEGKPDLVLAFLSPVAKQEIFYGLSSSKHSPGTRDMIRQAEKAGIPVKVIEVNT